MGRMTFHTEEKTVVPPKAARAWMFDLQPDDHADPRFAALWKPKPGDGRKIASRAPTTVVTADTFNGQQMSFTDKLVGDGTIEIDGTGHNYKSRGTLTFTPDGAGTKMVMHIESEMGGIMGLFMPLISGAFKKNLAKDFAIHRDLMEEDWRRKPW